MTGPGRYEQHLAARPLPAETRAYLAALAPLVGGGDTTMPVTVAAADPDAWMRAPLFVGRAEDAATVDPMQLDGQSGDGSRGMPGIDAATVAPQLDRLFVARPAARSEEHTSELQSLMRTSYAVFCLKTKTRRH